MDSLSHAARRRDTVPMARLHCGTLFVLLATVMLSSALDERRAREKGSSNRVKDPAAEHLKHASYTRCLRNCELSSQTATLPDKARFQKCFESRCKHLKPDYSMDGHVDAVHPPTWKDEL